MSLDNKQVQNALESLFQNLKERGVRIDEKEKLELKSILAPTLKEFSYEDIQNVNVQKNITASITAYLSGNKLAFESQLKVLQDESLRTQFDPTLDNKLKLQVGMLATLTNILDPKGDKEHRLTPDNFKMLITAFEKQAKSPFNLTPSPEMKAKADKNAAAIKSEIDNFDAKMDRLLDDTLRNLYGGNNPTVNGEIEFPILGPVVGNLCACVHQASPDPKSVALMIEQITYNVGKADPIGLENIAKMNDELTMPGPDIPINRPSNTLQ